MRLELESCPELKYTTDDLPYPRGEIKVKTNGMIGGTPSLLASLSPASTHPYIALPLACAACLGYWKKPKETAESIVNGWSMTGDIGEREPGGPYLRIIDRRKNFVELYWYSLIHARASVALLCRFASLPPPCPRSNHESVWLTPEPLQALYTSHIVQNVFLHGERHAPFLCAVVIPRPDFMTQWKREHVCTCSISFRPHNGLTSCFSGS